MKKYYAFVNGMNSGIVSKEEAHKWAAKILGDHPKFTTIHIGEVIETAERTTPTIEVKTFFTELDEPALKAKAA